MTTIQQLRELEAKAANRPWEAEDCTVFSGGRRPKHVVCTEGAVYDDDGDGYVDRSGTGSSDDFAFIASLRNAAPHLFAVVEAAERLRSESADNNPCPCPVLRHEYAKRLDAALADFRNAK